MDIKAEAANALWSLAAGSPDTQSLVVQAGAVEPLVALLSEADMRTCRKAAAALTSLAVGSGATRTQLHTLAASTLSSASWASHTLGTRCRFTPQDASPS